VTTTHDETESTLAAHEREIVLRIMAASAFLIFFQSYLVAPLIPSLAVELHASQAALGWLVPAYMLAYGCSTLFYGPLSDRIGRKPVLLTLIGFMALTTAGTASAQNIGQLLAWRAIAGVAAGGIIPIALALMGDLFPYSQRGHAIGWIFGAIAGGMAFGSTLGALLNPVIGWRMVFLLIAAIAAATFWMAWLHRAMLGTRTRDHPLTFGHAFRGYAALLRNPRGLRTYSFIMINGMFHSGIFTWLGLYFSKRYGLGDRGIGLALLGYGIPGMLLGPAIGRMADRLGRRTIIPAGLLLAAIAAAVFAPNIPLWAACAAATLLSLGYDMSHPLLAGIVTNLDPARRGQAMGLNAFVLFMGFGIGALLFQWALSTGFASALLIFAGTLFVVGLIAIRLFHDEAAHHGRAEALPIAEAR
jgi:predicted MFS family arabinose efflux permease